MDGLFLKAGSQSFSQVSLSITQAVCLSVCYWAIEGCCPSHHSLESRVVPKVNLNYCMACLNNFRIRVVGVQENQAHTINSYTPETSNLKFQPILWKYHFYSMATWHPCPFSTEIETLMDLAENLDLRLQYLI